MYLVVVHLVGAVWWQTTVVSKAIRQRKMLITKCVHEQVNTMGGYGPVVLKTSALSHFRVLPPKGQ